MTATIQARLSRLEASRAPDDRLTVIVRRLADGPWKGEVVRVCQVLTGRAWMRTDDEPAQAFAERIQTEGGPRVAIRKCETA